MAHSQGVSQEAARLHAAVEEARREGAQLVARTVAHALNNTLTPVVGFAELLALEPAVAGSPTAARYVALIAEAADDAVDKVARLQHVTRLTPLPTTTTPAGPVLDLSIIPPADA